MDSVGSNIKVNFKETEVLRVLPVLNDTLNEEWISDKTRFSFDGLKNQRIGTPFMKDKNGNLTAENWENSLIAFASNLEKALGENSNETLIVCGKQADLETSKALSDFAANFNIPFVNESNLILNSNIQSLSKFSTTFDDILESDLCLLVGTNPRFEASLLNVRMKKRMSRGLFKVASIGLPEDLTYSSENLGVSIESLISLLEGKHPFCQQLVKAQKPIIILGESALKRKDGIEIQQLVTNLSKYTKVIQEDWVGLNYLPTTASSVGDTFLGLNNTVVCQNNLEKVKFFFGVGMDNPAEYLKQLKVNCFSVFLTAFSDSSLVKSDLILPGAAFTEKEGTFLNLEGRAQKTEIALTTPGLGRVDSTIIKAFGEHMKFSSLKKKKFSFLNIENNKASFTKDLLHKKVSSKKIYKNSFKGVISDFFLSNAIAKNSKIMAKCSSNFRKSFTNF
jgi:NADH dehydrogenase/NADH:ubiquinone oxidoreductase subunit G